MVKKTMLDERVRNAKPDYIRVDKERLLSQLGNAERKSQRAKKRVAALKPAVVALSGVVVATVVFFNIPLHRSSSNIHVTTGSGGSVSSTSSTNTGASSTAASSTTTTKPSYSYFGIKASFRPMIPTSMPSVYHLNTSDLQINLHHKKTDSYLYDGRYMNTKDKTQVLISEVPGDSMKDYTIGAMDSTVPWQKTVRVKNQTYYLHPAGSKNGWTGNIVGFVKDNVVYELSSNHVSEDALLKFAQGAFRPAPIKMVDRLASTYKDAINNVSFHPVSLPTALSSTWVLQGAGSDFSKIGSNSTNQTISFEYSQRNNGKKVLEINEEPLDNAQNQFASYKYYVSTKWKDSKRGLEIQVAGNMTKAELNQIVNSFKAST